MSISPPSGIEISYRLRTLGWTQSNLARELNVSSGMVNNVIHNRVTCHRVAVRIAELLNLPMQVLWPGRYEYKPRTRRSTNKETTEGGETMR